MVNQGWLRDVAVYIETSDKIINPATYQKEGPPSLQAHEIGMKRCIPEKCEKFEKISKNGLTKPVLNGK